MRLDKPKHTKRPTETGLSPFRFVQDCEELSFHSETMTLLSNISRLGKIDLPSILKTAQFRSRHRSLKRGTDSGA